jgi:hypothetical protein
VKSSFVIAESVGGPGEEGFMRGDPTWRLLTECGLRSENTHCRTLSNSQFVAFDLFTRTPMADMLDSRLLTGLGPLFSHLTILSLI